MRLKKLITAVCISIVSHTLYASEAIEPIMVTVSAGSFAMGSLDRESTQPIHTVNIKEFSMGKYEVTVREFRAFIEATGYKAPESCRHEMDSWFLMASNGNWETNALNTSEFQPVICIDWRAAHAYTKWLAKETGKPYRLPTEAEWEYAARAGTKTRYYFGEDVDNTKVCNYENTGDLSGENILQRDSNTSYFNWSGKIANCSDFSGYASIVGMYKPNPFGLHDMISNVREMLADCYANNYEHLPADGSAYISENCDKHSIRGSSWHWSHWPIVNRGSIDLTFSGGVDGFRLALDGTQNKTSKPTTLFSTALNFAQQQEHKSRAIKPSIPAPVDNLMLEQTATSAILTWDKSREQGRISYRVYRNKVAGEMIKLLATNLPEPRYVDHNIGANIYDYTVVAVRHNLQSNYSNVVTTKAGWIKTLHKIEAEWATKLSGASTTFSSDERGGSVLSGREGIADQAEIIYQIKIPESGLYNITYRVASNRDIKGFELISDNEKSTLNSVNNTGGYHEWSTQHGGQIKLIKGNNIVVLKSFDNNWKLNWFSLSKI